MPIIIREKDLESFSLYKRRGSPFKGSLIFFISTPFLIAFLSGNQKENSKNCFSDQGQRSTSQSKTKEGKDMLCCSSKNSTTCNLLPFTIEEFLFSFQVLHVKLTIPQFMSFCMPSCCSYIFLGILICTHTLISCTAGKSIYCLIRIYGDSIFLSLVCFFYALRVLHLKRE